MALLEVKNITKRFGDTEVLKGIGFELEKGEVLAIIGSSGSGKTTLLRCLNFLSQADSGEIIVGGEMLFNSANVQRITDEEIRQKRLHFGLVFQQFNLFPQYNALKNVMLADQLLTKERYNKQRKLEKKQGNKTVPSYRKSKQQLDEEVKERAVTLLTRVGLADKLDSYPCELSGGQQQRVAIARALALNPDILCFDEPTSALDPELTGEVLKVIKDLKSSDSTMIVVTHEMEFAKNVADKIIFMADGVIEEFGTPEQVFDHPQSQKTKNFLSKSDETF